MKLFKALMTAAAFVIATTAHAAPLTVEIVSMAHYPVQNAVKPIRDMLGKYGTRIRVVELDVDAADGVKRLKSAGLKGHIPLVIFVDGKYRYQRANGSVVEFINFPAAAGNPMGLNGTWSAADVEAVIQKQLK